MDGLILAAGLGTRLGPIGRETPKALIEVGGRTMLEQVAERLVRAGVDRLVVNVHHHAERVKDYLAGRDLGAEVVVSHEVHRPLETGGALLHARHLLREDAPFFVHNVDVLCDADLTELHRGHLESRSGSKVLATMAVHDRSTERHLLFDEEGLFGRSDARKGLRLEARPPRGPERAWAFAGIHVVEPEVLGRITEVGAFPILDLYMRLVAEGGRIAPGPIGGVCWMEIGSPERLAAARTASRADRPVGNAEVGPAGEGPAG